MVIIPEAEADAAVLRVQVQPSLLNEFQARRATE